MTFDEWVSGLGLEFFSAEEVLINCDRPPNSPPPPHLWKNFEKTIKILDHLRGVYNRPIILSSVYRNDEYNRQVGGAANSTHTYFMAADFSVSGINPKIVGKDLLTWRGQGRFKGGVGIYQRFTHLDTRGTNRTWWGNY